MNYFKILLFGLFTMCSIWIKAQKSLQIIMSRFGKVKKYEVFNNDQLDYRLKGQFFYHTNRIVNLQDSTIVFENDQTVKLNAIRAIRIHTGGHLAKTFEEVFMIGGIGFLGLNTANNAINDVSPLIDNRALYVSGALIAASMLTRFLSTRYLRIGPNKTLRINDVDFTKLNDK